MVSKEMFYRFPKVGWLTYSKFDFFKANQLDPIELVRASGTEVRNLSPVFVPIKLETDDYLFCDRLDYFIFINNINK